MIAAALDKTHAALYIYQPLPLAALLKRRDSERCYQQRVRRRLRRSLKDGQNFVDMWLGGAYKRGSFFRLIFDIVERGRDAQAAAL